MQKLLNTFFLWNNTEVILNTFFHITINTLIVFKWNKFLKNNNYEIIINEIEIYYKKLYQFHTHESDKF